MRGTEQHASESTTEDETAEISPAGPLIVDRMVRHPVNASSELPTERSSAGDLGHLWRGWILACPDFLRNINALKLGQHQNVRSDATRRKRQCYDFELR